MNYPSMDRLAELQQLIADFAKIERVIEFADNRRLENDVEHSFGLALTCWYLHSKVAPELDLLKILRYALAHDLVEIHAGDTYVFDEDKRATKDARERSAIEQLRETWPDFSDISDDAEKYFEKSDEEAKFVKAVDKLIAPIVIDLSGNDKFWKLHSINLDMLRENKKTIHVSDYVSPYYEKLLDWLDQRDNVPKH